MDMPEDKQRLFLEYADDCAHWSNQWIVQPDAISDTQSLLEWRASGAETTKRNRNLKDFSASLKASGIIDSSAVNLPGCYVVLPHGSNLLRMFNGVIEDTYLSTGLNRYDYPMVAPVSNFKAADAVIPLKDQVLYVGTDSDFSAQNPRAGLLPTGEEVIYEHWKQSIRTKADLPIEMYRQTRFFRPHTSSRSAGVFRSMESADIFEFHCCYADLNTAKQSMQGYFNMYKKLSAVAHIPTIFGIRPLWANQHRISYLTIGGDTLLPIAGSVQTSALYLQGQSFSRVLPIMYKEEGRQLYTEHVTGAVSRRVMLSHLMLGWNEDGSFFVHPDLCPVKCKLVYLHHGSDDQGLIQNIVVDLNDAGHRVSFEVVDERNSVRSIATKAKAESVPLRVFIHGRRDSNDKFKVVFERSSDPRQASVFIENIQETLPDIIRQELKLLRIAHSNRMVAFMREQLVLCDTPAAAVEVANSNKAALIPLSFDGEAVEKLDRMGAGEVVSLIPRVSVPNAPDRCALTGLKTQYVACLTKRI